MKAVVAAFNQEKALVGALSVITNPRMDLCFKLYYRRPLNSAQDTRKLLIFLQGGGLCAPAAGYSCWARCKDGNPLCTAATEPELDPGHHDNIFSSDPVKNPAFFDFNYGECDCGG